MKDQSPKKVASGFRLNQAIFLLLAAFALAYPAFAYYGHEAHGQAGIAAATVAGCVCFVAGLIALMMLAMFREPSQAVNGVGLAMLFRMALPMMVGMFLTKLGGPLAEAGVFGMIVGFYLIGLLVETLLAVRLVNSFREEQVTKAT